MPASTSRKGTVGTYLPSGIVTGIEDNDKLRWDLARGTPTASGVYSKMLAQDPQIAGMVQGYKAILLGAGVEIVAPEEADDNELRITEFVEQAWQNQQGGPKAFLREALTYIDQGFSIFEEVYRRDADGMLVWDKFGHRPQATVRRWEIDPETDDLGEVEFWAAFDGVNFKLYRLPAQWLTMFTRNRVGNNFEGVSALRPSFTFWLAKRQVIRGTAIDVERVGHGFMEFRQTTESGPITTADEDRHAAIALNWRTNAHAYATIPYGFALDIKFPDIPFEQRVAWIQYLDSQIAKTLLMTFLELGLAKAGTQALGGTLLDVFMLALQAEADYVADVMNAIGGTTAGGPIRRLVDYNFGPQERYPLWRFGRLDRPSAEGWLSTVTAGKQAEVFGEWRAEDANKARARVDLDPLDEDDAEDGEGEDDTQAPPPATEPPEDEGTDDLEPDKGEDDAEEPEVATQRFRARKADVNLVDAVGRPMLGHREMTAAESFMAFSELNEVFDLADEVFEDTVRPILDRAGRKVARSVREIVFGPGTAAEKVVAVRALGISEEDVAALQKAVGAYLQRVAENTAASTRREIRRQINAGGVTRLPGRAPVSGPGLGLTPVPVTAVKAVDVAEHVAALSEVRTYRLVDDITGGLQEAGYRAAQLGPDGAGQAIRDLDELVTAKSPGWFRDHAARSVAAVVSTVREQTVRETLTEIDIKTVAYVQYTSLMDDRSCDSCAAADGAEFPYGSSEYFRLMPPSQCDGRARCRCMLVYVATTEEAQLA